jgi:hypothetical protein
MKIKTHRENIALQISGRKPLTETQRHEGGVRKG